MHHKDISDLAWESRLFSKIVRKLEIMGCLRRVKAKSQYSKPGRVYHRCIKFIREPENEEWQLFRDPVRGLHSHLKEKDNEEADADGDIEEDDEVNPDIRAGSRDTEVNGGDEDLQEIGRAVPQWTPDKNLSNFLFELVSSSGTRGMSTMVCLPSRGDRYI